MDPGGDAFLTINTYSLTSSPVGTYTIYVLLSRNKSIHDTETQYFTFELKILNPPSCTPNLILPSNVSPNQRFTHKIGTSIGIITF